MTTTSDDNIQTEPRITSEKQLINESSASNTYRLCMSYEANQKNIKETYKNKYVKNYISTNPEKIYIYIMPETLSNSIIFDTPDQTCFKPTQPINVIYDGADHLYQAFSLRGEERALLKCPTPARALNSNDQSSAVCEQFIVFYVSFLFLVLFSFFWFFFQNSIHYLNAHTLTTGFEWYQTKLNKQDLDTHTWLYIPRRERGRSLGKH